MAAMDVVIERLVAGGSGLARESSGRVVLVDGALPGETVRVEVTRSKKRLAEGCAVEVLDPSPGRVVPPCEHFEQGCGGCDLLYASPETLRSAKVAIVEDALRRIAKRDDVPVDAGEILATEGVRTVLRCGVVDGVAGLRERRSHRILGVADCRVAHPLIREILDGGRFPGVEEVTIRVGARTGERMVVIGEADPSSVVVPGDVAVATSANPRSIHEMVARHRFEIGSGSFFQARPDGAEALIRSVQRALGGFDPRSGRLVDLYGGVGLFTVGLGAGRSTLVERSASSCADARVNTGPLGTKVVETDARRWRATSADAVVADPPRSGLGVDGVSVVVATGAPEVALVSCDPASLARDVQLLGAVGYDAVGVELVDMFPGTHHVEAVTTLRLR